MIKYEATGLVHYISDTAPTEIHGFIFVSTTPSTQYYKYDISSFFLGWGDFIFSGNQGYLDFQLWEDHGMDGDVGQSLLLQKNDTESLISGSERVIMDRPLIQNPGEFMLPNTLRYMGGIHNIDERLDSYELWLHRACIPEHTKCKLLGWLCRCHRA